MLAQLKNRGFAITSTIPKRPNGRYCFNGVFLNLMLLTIMIFIFVVKTNWFQACNHSVASDTQLAFDKNSKNVVFLKSCLLPIQMYY